MYEDSDFVPHFIKKVLGQHYLLYEAILNRISYRNKIHCGLALLLHRSIAWAEYVKKCRISDLSGPAEPESEFPYNP